MNKSRLIGAFFATVYSFITLPSEAALFSVFGGQAYYDSAADLTWLTNANAAGTTMDLAAANAWAASLNIGGVTGWRLPDTLQPDSSCGTQKGGNSTAARAVKWVTFFIMYWVVLRVSRLSRTKIVTTTCFTMSCLTPTGQVRSLRAILPSSRGTSISQSVSKILQRIPAASMRGPYTRAMSEERSYLYPQPCGSSRPDCWA